VALLEVVDLLHRVDSGSIDGIGFVVHIGCDLEDAVALLYSIGSGFIGDG
jgi:hypothetical protein